METIINLSDLDPRDLPVVERLFGRQLDKTANAVFRDDDVATEGDPPAPSEDATTGDTLPDWCDMYAGLSDAQIADLESVVLKRANLTRSID